MALHLVQSADERLVSPAVEACLRQALAAAGRAQLLVPSFAQALAAQRELTRAGGLSLGVTVTTLGAWVAERWEVWGDGRRMADGVSRQILATRVLAAAAAKPGAAVRNNTGTARLLADLAAAGLPWLAPAAEAGERPEGVTPAEQAVVDLLPAYERELAARGLVEERSVMAGLAGWLAAAGAQVPPLVLAGHGRLGRAERELVCGLAALSEVSVVAHVGQTPAFDRVRGLFVELERTAQQAGVSVERVREDAAASSGEKPCVPAVGTVPARAPELQGVLARLFTAGAEPLAATGAVRVALPAGPSAEPELVVQEVCRAAGEGAASVAVAAPNAAAAWRELAPRLAARGISAQAQLSVPVAQLEAGRAYLGLARTVAQLAELDRTWPAPTPVKDARGKKGLRMVIEGQDMSWWPPRAVSDFFMSNISHVSAAQAQALDARWRANRLLTPSVLLNQLQSEKDVSTEVAFAVKELLRGRLGSAASKLLAPYVQGNKTEAPEAPEARAALGAVLAVAKTLKELGFSADPTVAEPVALTELVAVAEAALERSRVVLRPRLAVPGSACTVRVLPVSAAAQLEPASVDAVVLLGQTSTESAVQTQDDVASALLEAYGAEHRTSAMEQARARFDAVVRAARLSVTAERLLFGADGKAAYASVMLTELLACYGLAADARPADIAAALGAANVPMLGESAVHQNASVAGAPARLAATERPAPAGKIAEQERELVSPPPEGVSQADARPILSASQIETYLECPYKWFSLRRLKLQDADAGFTGAEIGTFAHRVLEVTHKELLARGVERQLGTRDLADMRAADPLAMQSAPYRAKVEELVARAQAAPELRVEGSSPAASPEALAEARAVLSEEFDAHLSHMYQLMGGKRPLMQALVPHTAQDLGQLKALRRDLLSLLEYEAGAFVGYEPRFFEWKFGDKNNEVEYAGVLLKGTVDRIDVDAHGQASVIDYKHKSQTGFAAEYDAFGKEGAPADGFALPRRVQSLVYGQVVRRAFPQLAVRSSVYLCTKDGHAIAGAVDEGALDNTFGAQAPSSRRAPKVAVPRQAAFGQVGGAGGMEALLDACEEAIAAKLRRMLAGDIEAAPLDASSCSYCPVLNCERRIRK